MGGGRQRSYERKSEEGELIEINEAIVRRGKQRGEDRKSGVGVWRMGEITMVRRENRKRGFGRGERR